MRRLRVGQLLKAVGSEWADSCVDRLVFVANVDNARKNCTLVWPDGDVVTANVVDVEDVMARDSLIVIEEMP